MNIFKYFNSVGIVQSVAIGITFTSIEDVLKIISLLLAISYGVWKWQSEWKKKS